MVTFFFFIHFLLLLTIWLAALRVPPPDNLLSPVEDPTWDFWCSSSISKPVIHIYPFCKTGIEVLRQDLIPGSSDVVVCEEVTSADLYFPIVPSHFLFLNKGCYNKGNPHTYICMDKDTLLAEQHSKKNNTLKSKNNMDGCLKRRQSSAALSVLKYGLPM